MQQFLRLPGVLPRISQKRPPFLALLQRVNVTGTIDLATTDRGLGGEATGKEESSPLRLQFDRSVNLVFRDSSNSSVDGLLLHRELDDALGLTNLVANLIRAVGSRE